MDIPPCPGPSRSGGPAESVGYRGIAGETLSYFHERVWEVRGGRCPSPAHFGGMGKPVNPGGFSDHFPIAMTLHEAD